MYSKTLTPTYSQQAAGQIMAAKKKLDSAKQKMPKTLKVKKGK